MPNKIDLTGQRFGRLAVIQEAGRANSQVLWLCQCDCGNLTKVLSSNLRRGNTRSCGCIVQEQLLKHGHASNGTQTAIYTLWANIIRRCYNKNNENYKYYGERGITMHDQWRSNFEAFLTYILFYLGEKPPGMVIDRINNDRGYEPGNLRWTTHSESIKNRRPHKHSRLINWTPRSNRGGG